LSSPSFLASLRNFSNRSTFPATANSNTSTSRETPSTTYGGDVEGGERADVRGEAVPEGDEGDEGAVKCVLEDDEDVEEEEVKEVLGEVVGEENEVLGEVAVEETPLPLSLPNPKLKLPVLSPLERGEVVKEDRGE
jgi:hypothetical protein